MAAGASRGKQKLTKEATTAQQLANLCRKAIQVSLNGAVRFFFFLREGGGLLLCVCLR